MNINSSGAVSTLVPESVAAARGPAAITPATESGESKSQNWAATKEVQKWASSEVPEDPGAAPDNWATTQQVDIWASRAGPEKPQIKAKSWATTQEATNWASDGPAGEAFQRVDIKV